MHISFTGQIYVPLLAQAIYTAHSHSLQSCEASPLCTYWYWQIMLPTIIKTSTPTNQCPCSGNANTTAIAAAININPGTLATHNACHTPHVPHSMYACKQRATVFASSLTVHPLTTAIEPCCPLPPRCCPCPHSAQAALCKYPWEPNLPTSSVSAYLCTCFKYHDESTLQHCALKNPWMMFSVPESPGSNHVCVATSKYGLAAPP